MLIKNFFLRLILPVNIVPNPDTDIISLVFLIKFIDITAIKFPWELTE